MSTFYWTLSFFTWNHTTAEQHNFFKLFCFIFIFDFSYLCSVVCEEEESKSIWKFCNFCIKLKVWNKIWLCSVLLHACWRIRFRFLFPAKNGVAGAAVNLIERCKEIDKMVSEQFSNGDKSTNSFQQNEKKSKLIELDSSIYFGVFYCWCYCPCLQFHSVLFFLY